MRYIIVAALLAAGTAHADYIAQRDGNSVRLTEKPCPAEIAKLVPDEWREMAQYADAVIEGKHFEACYALRSDGWVILQYEDKDLGAVRVDEFHKANDI